MIESGRDSSPGAAAGPRPERAWTRPWLGRALSRAKQQPEKGTPAAHGRLLRSTRTTRPRSPSAVSCSELRQRSRCRASTAWSYAVLVVAW